MDMKLFDIKDFKYGIGPILQRVTV